MGRMRQCNLGQGDYHTINLEKLDPFTPTSPNMVHSSTSRDPNTGQRAMDSLGNPAGRLRLGAITLPLSKSTDSASLMLSTPG
jgi:hypothetical protein